MLPASCASRPPAAHPPGAFFKGCSILSRANLDSVLSILGLRESQWENSHELQGYRILGCHDHSAGYLEMAVPNRDELKIGKTETRISLLAIRRVQLRINRALKLAARVPS